MRNANRIVAVADRAADIIDLATAKAHLRVTHTDDDDYITDLIEVATAYIEGPDGCGVGLTNRTWRLSLDGFNYCGMTVPMVPVNSITGISYTDAAGTTQTLDPSLYAADLDTQPVTIRPKPNTTFPVTQLVPGSVKITFVAGYGTTADKVPAPLRHAALLLIGHWYERREAASAESLTAIPFGIENMLNSYRCN